MAMLQQQKALSAAGQQVASTTKPRCSVWSVPCVRAQRLGRVPGLRVRAQAEGDAPGEARSVEDLGSRLRTGHVVQM
jgi:hypothetical protein